MTTTLPPARPATQGEGTRPAGPLRLRLPAAPAWLDGPMTTSHLVLGAGGMLLAIGLVMVFSASAVTAAMEDEPAWAPGVKQLVFAVIGLGALLVALRLPASLVRRWIGRAMIVMIVALVLVAVPGIGVKLNGARQWFAVGPVNVQPSEVAKLVFALWGAHLLAVRERYLTVKTLLVPILPVYVFFCFLLLLEPDFGSVVGLGLVVAGLLLAGGLPVRYWAGLVAVAAAGIVVLIQVAPYRAARITSFLDPFSDPTDGGYQAIKGLYALATGGLWGVGLGNSRMKWGVLPHKESDYIFAIIGEELGFLGCLVVVTLYGVLAYAGFRIARRSTDRFVQVASVAITVWLVGQATMNMGYVVGLLPVTGVQLPLISAGGTSLVLTLFIIGLLARFARSEPDAVAWGRTAERSRLARLLLPVPDRAVDAPVVRRPERDRGPSAPRPPGPRSGRTVSRERGVRPVPVPDGRPQRDPRARPDAAVRREPPAPRRAGTPREAAAGRDRHPGRVRTDLPRSRPSARSPRTPGPGRQP